MRAQVCTERRCENEWMSRYNLILTYHFAWSGRSLIDLHFLKNKIEVIGNIHM